MESLFNQEDMAVNGPNDSPENQKKNEDFHENLASLRTGENSFRVPFGTSVAAQFL
jgi:hypothetical protein